VILAQKSLIFFLVKSSFGEGLWVLSKPGSRPGEMASPKRDVMIMCDALIVVLSSPKRGDLA